MKRFVVLVTLLLTLLLPIRAFAQSAEESYQRLLALYDAYRSTYTQYINTRSQYIQYGTLSSRNDALIAVKNFLTARSNVLLEYLNLLTLTNKEPLYTAELSDHTKFIQAQQETIPAIATLDDAVDFSQQIERRHLPMHSLSRRVVGTTLTDRLDHVRLRILVLENDAALLIAHLRSQNKDVATLDRWLSDARNKRLLGEEKITAARTMLVEFDIRRIEEMNRNFSEIQQTLSQGNQYFKESLSFMKELSEAIKYGNY